MPRPDVPSSRMPEAFTGAVDAVLRRIRTADVLRAGAAGAGVGLLTTVASAAARFGMRVSLAVAVAAAALTMAVLLVRQRRSWTRAAAAERLERARPDSRNLIVTAEELLRNPHHTRPAILARVVGDAADRASGVNPSEVVPLRRATVLCALALAAWGAVTIGVPQRSASALRDVAARAGLVTPAEPHGTLRLTATLTPPAYLRAAVQQLDEPERIEAVAGTELTLAITGRGAEPRLRLGPETLKTSRSGDRTVARMRLEETTYLAVEGPAGENDRRLIPIVITQDRAPAIRIEQPGQDLLLPNASTTIALAATATDDFGLASLELRFTKVSGSGEQFAFEEGTIPLQVSRESERAWRGRASLALPQLKLEPGDALVYRVVGADRRPAAAGLASSDTFFVEIAGPDQVTLAGFELPPDRERYALSQQMILLKIQRLRAREPSMARDSVRQEAGAIAVEQRSVRANFIFLTGGHVEDEEEEAAHSHEIQEGRLEHRARREINDAIQHMSRAEQALIAVDTGAAMTAARAAVEALQRAFGRNRYFLRSLPVRSRLDPSRRLSGELDDAVDWRRTPEEAEVSAGPDVARDILAQLLDLAPSFAADSPGVDTARMSAMAERALTVDAASAEWQRISKGLLRLRDSIASGRPGSEVRTQLTELVRELQRESQRGAVKAVLSDVRARNLRGAWAETRRE